MWQIDHVVHQVDQFGRENGLFTISDLSIRFSEFLEVLCEQTRVRKFGWVPQVVFIISFGSKEKKRTC